MGRHHYKIHKGDKVLVISGKDRGKTGEVVRLLPKLQKAIVQGVNLVTKNIRPRRAGEKGQQIRVSAPVHISNLKLICPSCQRGVRAGYEIKGDRKIRVCRRCGQKI